MPLAGGALRTLAASLAVTSSDAWLEGKSEVVEVTWSSPRRLGEASAPSLQVEFSVDGAPVSLRLRRNDGLVTPRALERFHAADGSVFDTPLEAPQCYYLGDVDGDPLGRAGVSTCGGAISGIVLAHGRALAITPAAEGADVVWTSQGRSAHVVVALEDIDVLKLRVGIAGFVRRQVEPTNDAMGPARRLARGNLTVEMAVVNDAARLESFSSSGGRTAMTKNTLEVINGVAALYSRTDVFDYELEIRMVGQETFETDPWSVQKVTSKGPDGKTVEEVHPSHLLKEFIKWAGRSLDTPNDNRVLLSGHDFISSVAGIAAFQAMCSDNSASANMCLQKWPTGLCSFVVTHEAGHNLGMRHDGDQNSCAVAGFVMGAKGSAELAKTGEFSDCSVDYFNGWMKTHHKEIGGCLSRSGSGPDQNADIKGHAGRPVPCFVVMALWLLALARR